MKVTVPYTTRQDGVNLVLTLDALTDENGEVLYTPIKDEDGKIIGKRPTPSGYYILQNETGIKYVEAIDVENAPFTYTETDEKYEKEKQQDN